MPYRMHEKQIENVLALNSEERYLHFLNKVADWEQLWVLCKKDDNIFTRSTDEIEYLPVWPHPAYANESKNIMDSELEPREIKLDEFMESWLQGLESDGLKVGVFPDLDGKVWIMEPKDLLRALEEECEQYE